MEENTEINLGNEKNQKWESFISVIIPAYNAEAYIEKCIQSIRNQTYKDFEVIIVDDGSKDQTLELCRSFQKQDTRINIITKENGGVSSARNTGLKYAKGEYIAFVDSDDYIEKNYLELLVHMVLENHAEIGICGVLDKTETGKLLNKSQAVSKVMTVEETVEIYLKGGYFFCPMWAKLIKKSLFADVSFNEDTKRGEDLEIFPFLLSKCQKVCIDTTKYLYSYVVHNTSIIKNSNSEQIYQEYLISENMAEVLDERYPSLQKIIRQWYFNCCMQYNAEVLKRKDGKQYKQKLRKKLKMFYDQDKMDRKEYGRKVCFKIFLFSRLPFFLLYLMFQMKLKKK